MTIRAFRHLETTPPVVISCRRCHRVVVHGLAEGVIANADPRPLADEAAAITAGRITYTLTRTGLVQRDDTRRADTALTGPVLAQHRCPPAPPAPATARQLQIDFTRRTA